MALDQLAYAWGTGHNVALASLTNVARELKLLNRARLVPPTSQPIDIYPIRVVTLNGRVHGEGNISAAWRIPVLTPEALAYIITTYITTGGIEVVSKAITIYTARHDRLTYARYNAEIELPQPPNLVRGTSGDYRHEKGAIRDLIIKFRSLEPI